MFPSQIPHHAISAQPVSVNLVAVILLIFISFLVDLPTTFITDDIRIFFYTHAAISSNFSRICGFSVSSSLSNCLPRLVRSLILARHSSHSSPSLGSRLQPQLSHLYFHMILFLYCIQSQSHAGKSCIQILSGY